MRTHTMAEVKAAVPNFFEKGAMKFFNSRIASDLDQNNTFITSERFDENTPRKYTIRKFNPETRSIDTVGEFQQYITLAAARAARSKI